MSWKNIDLVPDWPKAPSESARVCPEPKKQATLYDGHALKATGLQCGPRVAYWYGSRSCLCRL